MVIGHTPVVLVLMYIDILTYVKQWSLIGSALYVYLMPCPIIMNASINEDSSVVSNSYLSQYNLPFVSDAVSVLSNGVRLIHHNVEGLLSKMPKITQWFHICGSSPTILCCSETWSRSNDSVGQIPGYDFYCSPLHDVM